MRVLIANRGEIARRIIRTAHRLGHETVAVFADPDARAPHVSEATVAVNIGPADLAQSYLAADKILAAAAETAATAVHPGYGFLAENAPFAQAVIDAGLHWVGPHPAAIERMGSKIEARRIAADAGVPIIPGYDESQDTADLAAAADRIGYPVLVKAAAGGGGKGIRIAEKSGDFAAALAEASTEAERSFGDGAMIVERYIQRPRHVEVQIIGDKHGNVTDLGTRECSVQRRYQKVLEEAPAPNLPDATRQALRESAVALAEAMEYDSAGTVEFIVDDETGEHFFLEMNTRLQVEHPVTEAVTGLDLVELMLRAAEGEAIELGDVTLTGHAIEARINAEDASADFAPQIGTVTQLRVPDGVRWDAAIVEGSEITPFYDSMVAKLIVDGADRVTALRKLRRALDELVVGGLVTNTGLHRWLVDQDPIIDGRVTTRFLDETPIPDPPALDPESAAAAWFGAADENAPANPWTAAGAFSVIPRCPKRPIGLADLTGEVHELFVGNVDGATATRIDHPALVDVSAGRVAVNVDGHTQSWTVPPRTERWAPASADRQGSGDAIVAPFPASVAEVHVAPGDAITGDDVLVVIEAMKMLHSLRANGAAIVDEVRVATGDQVATDQVLVTFRPADADPDA